MSAPVPRRAAQRAQAPHAGPIAPVGAHGTPVAEIARVLAKGLLRATFPGEIGLALSPESEPSCGANAVNAPRALGRDRDGERER